MLSFGIPFHLECVARKWNRERKGTMLNRAAYLTLYPLKKNIIHSFYFHLWRWISRLFTNVYRKPPGNERLIYIQLIVKNNLCKAYYITNFSYIHWFIITNGHSFCNAHQNIPHLQKFLGLFNGLLHMKKDTICYILRQTFVWIYICIPYCFNSCTDIIHIYNSLTVAQ